MKILVLELDEKGKKITEALLEEHANATIIVFSPDDVYKILENERFDIIFVPLRIEGTDSFALCRRIKQHFPKCILYAYSWHLKLYDPDNLERVGFDGFIKRPTKKETLTKAIEGAMARLLQKTCSNPMTMV